MQMVVYDVCMVLFEVQHIYGVEHGDVTARTGSIVSNVEQSAVTAQDVWRAINVQGIQKNDFGLFVDIVDEQGVTSNVPYLVSHYFGNSSIIVPADMLEADTRRYATLELTRKLQSVPSDEIAQFGLGSLLQELTRRYPQRQA